jgi:hypothetical protein
MEILLQTLEKATSPDSKLVKEAEAVISSIESRPGYLIALLDAYGNGALSKKVRWMALICMKNAIEKCWRKGIKW